MDNRGRDRVVSSVVRRVRKQHHIKRYKEQGILVKVQGGLNLNEEEDGSGKEVREVRPIGRDRAKKKAYSSSRSEASSGARGGLVDMVAQLWDVGGDVGRGELGRIVGRLTVAKMSHVGCAREKAEMVGKM
ncbi:hypothetical protein Tco_1178651 [Tanacetum coccineum]